MKNLTVKNSFNPEKGNYIRKINNLFVFLILLVAFVCLSSCKDDEDDQDDQSFTLNVTVKNSSNEAIADAAVVLNNPVTVKVEREGISYYQFTRFRTSNNGVAIISNLPVKDEDEEVIIYKLTIYKSGFSSASQEIGDIIADTVTTEIIINAQTGTTDIKMALLDYELSYRANIFLTGKKLLFDDITGELASTDLSAYKTVALGYDASKIVDYPDEFVGQKTKLLGFVENGGTLFFFQQNDAGWNKNFFPVSLTLVDEELGNDFETGEILDTAHLLVNNLDNNDLTGWEYSEPGQSELKSTIVFDAIKKTDQWNGIIATPSTERQNSNNPETDREGNPLDPQAYWIAAEYIHGDGKIILCQAAYFQASFGDTQTISAQNFSDNVVELLKFHGSIF